ncbi:dihydrolipoamide acetyltransferase component of pyruvate dehydrogenase complex [Arenicella chitinivorans]|uniref:Dihydrolipoamide acetyltransferase component of pyruvate dehydrogenase complex n=1 Tax=Arenicella chitinivorans TaxID=1329800 RepID=A0A918VHU5_9GAMM|nr:dihydrolipoamide acetyltransferase family protein [Arenicella chitinivorans]GGZ97348.1 dihydrolipoamide acetyltransferase component of pyruvate dehydrogenase complex [Arenicella chitinivorans]
MGIHTIRLPDVGEGIAEAELVEWHVSIGDQIEEDDVVAAVMTDKAAVEVPSAVAGKVVWLGGEIGDLIAVGAKLIQLEVAGDGNDSLADVVTAAEATVDDADEPATSPTPVAENEEAKQTAPKPVASKRPMTTRVSGAKPLAAPSVRARAREEGVDLRSVPGTGPAGRISHQDLSDFIESGGATPVAPGAHVKNNSVKEVKVIGMRRKIAEKMSLSKSRIPHITIVEEIDMTELEELRLALNKKHAGARPKLTLLPFLMRAIVEAVREQPELNARFDDDAGVIHQYGAVNIGIATQTDNGLNVTVVQHAEAANLWQNAQRVSDLADAARAGTIRLEDLTGGTITITSLGAMGAIATTPIINHPEVAIVGVNKMQIRPMWDGQQFQPCKMMNISCSFDHRVIDGWDAAVFVQKLKTLLESPAMLFVES